MEINNWALNCQNIGTSPNTHKLCEVIQSIIVEGQKDPLARIAIGRLSADNPWHATLVLPTNITLPSVVHMESGSKATSLDLNWSRCVPGACFAEAPLTTELLAQWRMTTDAGKVTFIDAQGRAVTFPMSFKGLNGAIDALGKAR